MHFHDTRINVISFTPLSKAWPSMCRFPRNAHKLNNTMCVCYTAFNPNQIISVESIDSDSFTSVSEVWCLLRRSARKTKCSTHIRCRSKNDGDLQRDGNLKKMGISKYRISPKTVRKYGMLRKNSCVPLRTLSVTESLFTQLTLARQLICKERFHRFSWKNLHTV
jgi:hypothetical protein